MGSVWTRSWVHSPISAAITAGFLIYLITAICIGIIAGLFLYKTNILNINKPSNGLRYGFLVGTIVYLVFAIPVEQFDLDDEFEHTLSSPSNVVAANPSHNNNNEVNREGSEITLSTKIPPLIIAKIKLYGNLDSQKNRLGIFDRSSTNRTALRNQRNVTIFE